MSGSHPRVLKLQESQLRETSQASCGGHSDEHSVLQLPQDLCEILTALQQDAPKHSYAQTCAQIQRSFGHPVEAIFDSFEEQPLASASIAQVGSCKCTLH